MDSESDTQSIRCKSTNKPSFPSNGLHAKVSRTDSICDDIRRRPTSALAKALRYDLQINRRSSPDGSADESDHLAHLRVAGKQIDERSLLLTTAAAAAAAAELHESCKMIGNGCRGRPTQPDICTGDEELVRDRTLAEITQAYRNEDDDDDFYGGLETDMMKSGEFFHGPVVSDSRGELLQCDTGPFVLEDVLRHYWLLSDRDDENPRATMRNHASSSSASAQRDFTSKRFGISYAHGIQPTVTDTIRDGDDIFFDYDRDDDAASIATLSTISEENSEDLSSTAESNGMAHLLDRSGQRLQDLGALETHRDEIAIIDHSKDTDVVLEETSRINRIVDFERTLSRERSPDGLDSEDNDVAMVGSIMRRFSDYVSDIYPFSPAFVNIESNDVYDGEANNSVAVGSPSNTSDTYTEYTITDTKVHLKFVQSSEDPSKAPNYSHIEGQLKNSNSVSPVSNSETRWSPSENFCSATDGRSSIASPSSWYTISDVFDSQSFETASEMAEDEPGQRLTGMVHARCTAVARCLTDPPPDHQDDGPTSADVPNSTSVSTKVSSTDPLAALARATAQATSLAVCSAVKIRPSSEQQPNDIEVIVTTRCVISRQNQLDMPDYCFPINNCCPIDNFSLIENFSPFNNCSPNDNSHPRPIMNSFRIDGSSEEAAGDISRSSKDDQKPALFEGLLYKRTRDPCFSTSTANGSPFRTMNGSHRSHFESGDRLEAEGEMIEELMSALDASGRVNSVSCHVAIPRCGLGEDLRPCAFYGSTSALEGSERFDYDVACVAVNDKPRQENETQLNDAKYNSNDNDFHHEAEQQKPRFTEETHSDQGTPIDNGLSASRISVVDTGSEEDGGGDRKLCLRSESIPISETRTIRTLEVLSLVDSKSSRGGSRTSLDSGNETEKGNDSAGLLVGKMVDGISVNLSDLSQSTNEDVDQRVSTAGEVNASVDDSKNFRLHHPVEEEDIVRSQGPETEKRDDDTAKTELNQEGTEVPDGCVKTVRCQSLLLETDIDTLEHRRTAISGNQSRFSIQETKSCSNLTSTKETTRRKSNTFSWNDSVLNKETLEDMLSECNSASYFGKKRLSWSSQSQSPGHYVSEPSLQTNPERRTASSAGKSQPSSARRSHDVSRNNLKIPHLIRRRSSSSQDDTGQKKCHTAPCSIRPGDVKAILRYDQSPSLRRRSLSLTHNTSLQDGNEEADQEHRHSRSSNSKDQGGNCRARRHSGSLEGSSFENLVDSLLGITAVMSMDAAIGRPTSKTNAGKMAAPPACDASLPTAQPGENEANAPRTDHNQISLAESLGSTPHTTPMHKNHAARKHVHFRKAKHIFRKCHFCIESRDPKNLTPSPIRKTEGTLAADGKNKSQGVHSNSTKH